MLSASWLNTLFRIKQEQADKMYFLYLDDSKTNFIFIRTNTFKIVAEIIEPNT